jgi:hypothetical protein
MEKPRSRWLSQVLEDNRRQYIAGNKSIKDKYWGRVKKF